MECAGRHSNALERSDELPDELSHEMPSEEEMRDYDSIESESSPNMLGRNSHALTNGNGDISNFEMNLANSEVENTRASAQSNNLSLSQHHHQQHQYHQQQQQQQQQQQPYHHLPSTQTGFPSQFSNNLPLNTLSNFIGIGGLHTIPNISRNEVLEKLKLQEQDYITSSHVGSFGGSVMPSAMSNSFNVSANSIPSINHATQSMAAQSDGSALPSTSIISSMQLNATPSTSSSNNSTHNSNNLRNTNSIDASASNANFANNSNANDTVLNSSGSNNEFSFSSPTAPAKKDANAASSSSPSDDGPSCSNGNKGNGGAQNGGNWSFEEQYKQVRQLYEINDDPKRKEFLDDLFSFMQKRGTPINRLPIMAKSVLDLYELYNLVIARGGLVDVINKKLWQEIIKGLHLPSSITSAAFTLRTQYMKYLYPYECEKKNLSTPSELKVAIDGNRREGRRSSYGQYEAMHTTMQMTGMQQLSPLALVTHAAANNQQAQAAAVAAATHHRLMAPTFNQVPSLMTHELEQRMIEYLKLMHAKKDQNGANNPLASLSAVHQQQQSFQNQQTSQQLLQTNQRQQTELALSLQHQESRRTSLHSPTDMLSPEALNALEISRVALWQMYQNTTNNHNLSPPNLAHTPPRIAADLNGFDEQRKNSIKRERDRDTSPEDCDRNDFQHNNHNQLPPPKKPPFPESFYFPSGMPNMAAMAAANLHYQTRESDGEQEQEDEDANHNIALNSSPHHLHPLHSLTLNGGLINGNSAANCGLSHLRRYINTNNSNTIDSHHHDKSDDSAIENSPAASATSAGHGQLSPISTKKSHHQLHSSSSSCSRSDPMAVSSATSPFSALQLLSGMQIRVIPNGFGANGAQQLCVSLELNGVQFNGVLVANNSAPLTQSVDNNHVPSVRKKVAKRASPTATITSADLAAQNFSRKEKSIEIENHLCRETSKENDMPDGNINETINTNSKIIKNSFSTNIISDDIEQTMKDEVEFEKKTSTLSCIDNGNKSPLKNNVQKNSTNIPTNDQQMKVITGEDSVVQTHPSVNQLNCAESNGNETADNTTKKPTLITS